MKHINVEKLKDEIESISMIPQTSADYNDGRNDMKMMFLDIIDSLQQEQSKVDLEEEVEDWVKTGPHTSYPWCTIPDAIRITAEHFFELGLKTKGE